MAIYEHFPKFYSYFQTRSFSYGRRVYGNHNHLLGVDGIDGIKTGYTNAAGYNLLTAARANGRHIIVAAFGFNRAGARDALVLSQVRRFLPGGADRRLSRDRHDPGAGTAEADRHAGKRGRRHAGSGRHQDRAAAGADFRPGQPGHARARRLRARSRPSFRPAGRPTSKSPRSRPRQRLQAP